MESKYELNGVSLTIMKDALDQFEEFKQKDQSAPESGGLILGRTDFRGDTKIYRITVPKEKDKRNRFFFKRKDQEHIREVKKANEVCLYFKGNWHTHPQLQPKPSYVDICSWKKAIRKSKPGESDYIFFFIVGTKEINVWCGNMTSKKICEMNKISI